MTYDTEPPADLPPPPLPAPDTRPLAARAIAALFAVAARDGWKRTTLAAIATEAGATLAELRETFACREAILDAFACEADQAVLAGTVPLADGETVKDRLFDLLMRRLDALQPHRAGVLAVADGLRHDPAAALSRLPVALNSMVWMLEGAGVRAHGLGGMLRAKGLLAVALYTFRAWARDESQDMATTMAALDRALDRAGQVASWCENLPGRSRVG